MLARNPYQLHGPAQICFSGGRTSGYMLYQLLQANDGLPADAVVTFENTGKEREETLVFVHECGQRWGVPIVWLEWAGLVPDKPQREPAYRVVTFETASREGEPFIAATRAVRMLPNPVARICTINLKIRTGVMYMQAQGFDEWDAVMGIRADEPSRVARMLTPGRDNSAGVPLLPLNTAGVSKADVLAFWHQQAFDLALDPQGDLGNCDLCFLKARHKIVRAIMAEPERADWWIEREAEMGHPFRANRPPYADLKREAMFYLRQLPLVFRELPAPDDEPDGLADCICGDPGV